MGQGGEADCVARPSSPMAAVAAAWAVSPQPGSVAAKLQRHLRETVLSTRPGTSQRALASSGHDHGAVEKVRPWCRCGRAPDTARCGRGCPASGGRGQASATAMARWRGRRCELTGKVAGAHRVFDEMHVNGGKERADNGALKLPRGPDSGPCLSVSCLTERQTRLAKKWWLFEIN